MANIIDMPKLSDTMTVGTLIKWLKNEGDPVKTGDMLAEVETDKATMELESFFDGTLLKIFVPGGSQVPIGAALCAVGKPGENVAAPSQPSPPAQSGSEGSNAEGPARSGGEGKAAEGSGVKAPTPSETEGSPAQAPASPGPTGAGPLAAPPTGGTSQTPLAHPQSGGPMEAAARRIKISPLARKLAAERGIDPARVTGSGPSGRIVRADILAAEKVGTAPAPVRAAGTAAVPAAAEGRSYAPGAGAKAEPSPEDRVLPLSNMRATIARRTQESKVQAPHIYLEVEIDAGPLLALRTQLNEALEKEGVKLSVNDFILKACAFALKRVPAVNSSWEAPTGSGQPAVRQRGAIHVSFAVAIDDGLITPVIRDTASKTLFAISTEAKTLAKLAREKKLQPAQYTGGTFCVSNMGMLGIDRFCAIINQPNAAILAVGGTVKKPVVVNDAIAIGQRMSLTLSCDHRVLDGAIGAAFLAALRESLEKPALLLI